MTADEIVRKLAASDFVYDTMVCFFCDALVTRHYDVAGSTDAELFTMAEPHSDDCPYALALAYVEANPA